MRSQWSSLSKKLHPKTKNLKKKKNQKQLTIQFILLRNQKRAEMLSQTSLNVQSLPYSPVFSLSSFSPQSLHELHTKTLVCVPSCSHSHPIQWLPLEPDNCKRCLPTWDPPCHALLCVNISYSEFLDCFIRILFFPVFLCGIKICIFSSWIWTQGVEKIRGGESDEESLYHYHEEGKTQLVVRRGRTRNQPWTTSLV